MLDTGTPDGCLSALAQDWLDGFGEALASGDAGRIEALFHADCWWRDAVAFTGTLETFAGREAVADGLARHADRQGRVRLPTRSGPHRAGAGRARRDAGDRGVLPVRDGGRHGRGRLATDAGRRRTPRGLDRADRTRPDQWARGAGRAESPAGAVLLSRLRRARTGSTGGATPPRMAIATRRCWSSAAARRGSPLRRV